MPIVSLIKSLAGGGDKKPEATAQGFQGMNPEDERDKPFGTDMLGAPPKMTLGNPQMRQKPSFDFNRM